MFLDNFLGASIDGGIWELPVGSGNDGGTFSQNAGHLGFDSQGDVNGREVEAELKVLSGISPVLTPSVDWRFESQLFLNDSTMLGSAAPDEGVSLNVRVVNPNDGGDSMEMNFAILDTGAIGGPAGIDHLVRFGTRTDDFDVGEQITPLGTGAVAPELVIFRADYIAATQTITGFYDLGSGFVQFSPETDVGTWNMASGDEFEFALEAIVLKFSGGNPTGNFAIDGSQAHFGLASLGPVPAPEPRSVLMLLLGSSLALSRRRRVG